MLKMHELPGDPGRKQQPKRVGRGEGSGQGKTAGKGHKGQQARSGSGKGPAFEGGQMRLIRRLPKFGFNNDRFRVRRDEVDLRDLNGFEDGATVDHEAMLAAGIVSRQARRIKVLANGKLEKKLTVRAHGFSSAARAALAAAGGRCEEI